MPAGGVSRATTGIGAPTTGNITERVHESTLQDTQLIFSDLPKV